MERADTIYECPDCGAVGATVYALLRAPLRERGQTTCSLRGFHTHEPREVRVFREEDVRPLWDLIDRALRGDVGVMFGARDGAGAWRVFSVTRDAFPAPEDWR